jgi:hypothetical protein
MSEFHLTSVLLAIAMLAAVLFLVNTLFQRIRKADARPGWVSSLLGLAAVLAGTGVLTGSIGAESQFVFVTSLLLAGIGEAVLGVVVYLLLERRRSVPASQSFGVLYTAAGFYVLIAAIFVPLLPGQFRQASVAPILEASPVVTLARTNEPAPSPTIQSTATWTASPSWPTLDPTQTASPAATPTRIRYSTPTPIPTSIPEVVCGALANFNVNLRVAPSLDAQVLAVIPYQSVVQLGGRAERTNWWLAFYQAQMGLDRWRLPHPGYGVRPGSDRNTLISGTQAGIYIPFWTGYSRGIPAETPSSCRFRAREGIPQWRSVRPRPRVAANPTLDFCFWLCCSW